MKKCELCKSPARVLCDSDQANLCWECDARVHSANFLVAKHTRTLLCQACQSQTPWTGSGPKLGPTVSVCQACFSRNSTTTAPVDHDLENNGAEDEEEDDNEGENGGEEEEEDDDDDEEEEEEDDDNQVVPFSSSTQLQPPSLPSTSSSSEDSSTRFYRETDPNGFLSKRTDENASSHYDGIERPDENAYQRTTRSWTWR
ncbi:PREDICTED: zinc finger protein CONSTANS-LIKE 9-like [Ipomoea nil]|uniref:zinc finger protein CONSTANS-LIKE 9-like n=1 Tax=Ipomoea nil TaxID=35883 RepID=UPI000900FAA0|nr:PREDICTED: zinc finger protein CONSTANS-LIKE 9-like [Ipomoea nil]